MAWEIRSLWPGYSQFEGDRFGNQPVRVLLAALKYGKQLRWERLHQQELPIAQLTSMFFNANRGPKQEPQHTADFCFFTPRTKDEIPAQCCDTFFALARDSLVPAWVVALAPIGKLKAGKKGGESSSTRAIAGDGIFIVSPRVEGNRLKAPLAVLEGVTAGVHTLCDLDSGQVYSAQIPEQPGDRLWSLEVDFDLVA